MWKCCDIQKWPFQNSVSHYMRDVYPHVRDRFKMKFRCKWINKNGQISCGLKSRFNRFGILFCVFIKNTVCSDKKSEFWIIRVGGSMLLMKLFRRKCLRACGVRLDIHVMCRAEWKCSSLHSKYPQYWMEFTIRPLQHPVTIGKETRWPIS
jgi:hypothetical protein